VKTNHNGDRVLELPAPVLLFGPPPASCLESSCQWSGEGHHIYAQSVLCWTSSYALGDSQSKKDGNSHGRMRPGR
jgi:hypothetical protein